MHLYNACFEWSRHMRVHVYICIAQASQGQVIELDEEMTINDLAKKLRTNPSECVRTERVLAVKQAGRSWLMLTLLWYFCAPAARIAKIVRNIDTSFRKVDQKQIMEMSK